MYFKFEGEFRVVKKTNRVVFKQILPLMYNKLIHRRFDFTGRIIISYLIITGLILLVSCSSPGHVKFQGLPIDGDLNVFKTELQKKGYMEVNPDGEEQLKFAGLFLDHESSLLVFTTLKSHTPYMVRVDMPREAHDSIKFSYERIKKHCASILGPGASRYQQFNNSSRFLFNEPKLVREPKVGDYTRYLSNEGSVFLKVMSDYLSVIYVDKKNAELSVEEGGQALNLEDGAEY